MKKLFIFLLTAILLSACTQTQVIQDCGNAGNQSGRTISSNDVLDIIITDNAGLKMKEELSGPENKEKIHRVEFLYSGSG